MRWPASWMRMAAMLALGAGVLIAAVAWSARGPLYATILHSERITVYEGLPHQKYELKEYWEESKTKPTVQLHGFPFYREPLVLKREDVETLRGLLGTANTYEPFAGEKKCGGFHPDYAVEWTRGGGIYRCLICFGCSEARVYGPRGGISYDLRDETALVDLLKGYRKNRPPHERFGLGPLADDLGPPAPRPESR